MFEFWKNHLCLKQGARRIKLSNIAQKEKNPFYLYDVDGIKEGYKNFLKNTFSLTKVFYAMKANNNLQVLKAFQKLGSGVDVVSGGELQLALNAGFSPDKIVFSGVGKTKEELQLAIRKKVFQINVESLSELKALTKLAKLLKKKPAIALRINPNVDFKSHPYIKTGLSGHKFGFNENELPPVLDFIRSESEALHFQGLSMHLGSQIFDTAPFFQAIKSLKSLYEKLKKTKAFPLKTLDIGGGLGVDYNRRDWPDKGALIKNFGLGLKDLFQDFSDMILMEPGRFLLARFGLLCTPVEYIKKSQKKTFAIVHTGMHHFLRPALYGASHKILPFHERPGKKRYYEVVGPICETADTLSKKSLLPELFPGDWLAVRDTGAYGFVMANNYNLREEAKELSFSGGKKISNKRLNQ